MCSGRVDIAHVLRAFSKGMDGVFIGGCHFNDCNYSTGGNFHALNMTLLTKRLLEHIGVNPERLRMNVMSGSEGNLYVEHVNNFNKKVREIGPFAVAEGIDKEELISRVEGIIKLVPYIKVMMNEKLAVRLEKPEDPAECDKYFTREEIDNLLNKRIAYYIEPEKCQACMTCARRCPVGAVISAKGQVHIIDQDKCIRCGACMAGCPPRFSAIKKIEAGEPVPPPLPEGERTVVRKGKAKAEVS